MKSSIATAAHASTPVQKLSDHVVEFALDATMAVQDRRTGYLGRFASRRVGSAALGLPPGVLAICAHEARFVRHAGHSFTRSKPKEVR